MRLAEERNAIVSEKDAAVRQAVDLQNAVAALRQEVQEARSVGTPHGEGAKTVSRLALERIKKMQVGLKWVVGWIGWVRGLVVQCGQKGCSASTRVLAPLP